MKNQIKETLRRHFATRSVKYDPVTGLDFLAKAIAEMVERQPVNKVKAMAVLIHVLHDDYYLVPDGLGSVYTVWRNDSGNLRCPGTGCRSTDTCDHIRAVEFHLSNNNLGNQT